MIATIKNLYHFVLRVIEYRVEIAKSIAIILFRQNHQPPRRTGHVIAMKDTIYVSMGAFMALTLLQRNEDFKAVFHLDSDGFSFASKNRIIRFLVWKGLVSIHPCLVGETDPMRVQLRMFADLQGTDDFLMDADLWWKNPIPPLGSPLTFSVETSINSIHLLDKAAMVLKLKKEQSIQMITGCLTYWNSEFCGVSVDQALSLYDRLMSKENENAFRIDERRLIGQVVMSIMFNGLECFETLVDKSSESGRRIADSSFYGATGYTYGRG